MGKYWLDERNQIQACLAERIGKLAVQYENFCRGLRPEHQYNHTLCLSLLHTLLANCVEAMKQRGANERGRRALCAVLTDGAETFGLARSMVVRNTFPDHEPTLGAVLEHMRHAVSHPTTIDLHDPIPSTGYTATEAGGLIGSYVFIHSPDQNGLRRPRQPAAVFQIEVPAESMFSLVVGLSNYLAQPTLGEGWDGVTIRRIVAA